MAEVYAARVRGEAGFQKLVAVKRMLPQLADDEEFVSMFLDEARLAANINSPNCVHTLDLGRAEDGSLYIVMELVVGVTLARILRLCVRERRAPPLEVAVDLLCQAAQGLHDAHEATTPVGAPLQIVHRDVSPQNVLVGVDGRVRLTDFGVARAVLRRTETVAGRIKGKFAYCSPEQLMGRELDRRSDVFALGVVAWEFLAGQRLFVGEHPMETMERVRSMPIPAVHQLRADVPREVSVAIARALERNPARRTPTAQELAVQLRAAVRGRAPAATKEAVAGFVESAGGEALEKIRANIRLALSDETALSSLPDVGADLTLTPTGAHSAVKTIALERDTTDPTSTTGTLPQDPDASVPSALAGPGGLLPGVGRPEPPRRSALPMVVGLLLAIALAAAGGLAVWAWTGMTAPEPVVTPLALPPAPPEEPAAVAGEEPAAADPSAEPGAGVEAPVVESGVQPRAGRTGRRAHRRRRTDPQPAMETVPEPVAASVMEPVVSEMRVERDPRAGRTSPTMASTPSMRGGLVGVDAFDRDVARMN